MSFVMKKVESQIQDQILIQFIPEEFPLYHDLLLYGNLLQKRVRELITALPLMSYMAFEMLGSNS